MYSIKDQDGKILRKIFLQKNNLFKFAVMTTKSCWSCSQNSEI